MCSHGRSHFETMWLSRDDATFGSFSPFGPFKQIWIVWTHSRRQFQYFKTITKFILLTSSVVTKGKQKQVLRLFIVLYQLMISGNWPIVWTVMYNWRTCEGRKNNILNKNNLVKRSLKLPFVHWTFCQIMLRVISNV